MSLGTPCVVRDNAGNRSLIAHNQSGLLFATPDECVAAAERLLGDTELQQRLVCGALDVMRDLGARSERDEYHALVLKHAL